MESPVSSNSPVAAEEPDFYVEAGNVVFTAAYLKRRGTCCDSGCRHCPFGEPNASAAPAQTGSPAAAVTRAS